MKVLPGWQSVVWVLIHEIKDVPRHILLYD